MSDASLQLAEARSHQNTSDLIAHRMLPFGGQIGLSLLGLNSSRSHTKSSPLPHTKSSPNLNFFGLEREDFHEEHPQPQPPPQVGASPRSSPLPGLSEWPLVGRHGRLPGSLRLRPLGTLQDLVGRAEESTTINTWCQRRWGFLIWEEAGLLHVSPENHAFMYITFSNYSNSYVLEELRQLGLLI